MEPIADSEIKRVLVVNAHPDDSDFGASGTIAQWVKAGIEVGYVLCTNGDQGGEESGIPLEEMPQVRQREQREAGAIIGVTDITFLILCFLRFSISYTELMEPKYTFLNTINEQINYVFCI